jgi:hypothetical protein
MALILPRDEKTWAWDFGMFKMEHTAGRLLG